MSIFKFLSSRTVKPDNTDLSGLAVQFSELLTRLEKSIEYFEKNNRSYWRLEKKLGRPRLNSDDDNDNENSEFDMSWMEK